MIWCVEDDSNIREVEIYALNSAGYNTMEFDNGKTFLTELKSAINSRQLPDLIILDIMLPEINGIEVIKSIKQDISLKNIPILVASAKGTEFDKIQGFDLGVDDYIVKPFSIMEMLSRVKAILRRCGKSKSTSNLKFLGIEMNIQEYKVTIDSQEIKLTNKEFELLRMFLSNPKAVFTRDIIFDKIWGSNYIGDTRTLDMHIKTLRQKLKHYGNNIKTVRNVGYRLEN